MGADRAAPANGHDGWAIIRFLVASRPSLAPAVTRLGLRTNGVRCEHTFRV